MELLGLGFRFALALVFLNASIPKLLAAQDFETALANYRILPSRSIGVIARWLPRLELLSSLALFTGALTRAVSVLVGGLLVTFALGVGVNLLKGRTIDCGCSGATAPRKIGWGLVVQDAVLAILAFTVAIDPPEAFRLLLPWESPDPSVVSASDSIAVLAVTTFAFLGYLLLRDGFRHTRAARAFVSRLEGTYP